MKIEWKKDGQPLKYSQRIFTDYFLIDNKAVLIIQDVRREDEGKYELTARNIAGVGTASASLNVRLVPVIEDRPFINPEAFQKFELKPIDSSAAPNEASDTAAKARLKIVEPLRDFILVEGAPAVFNCKIDAYPKAEVFLNYT